VGEETVNVTLHLELTPASSRCSGSWVRKQILLPSRDRRGLELQILVPKFKVIIDLTF
jgi:hypothetical protein